MKRFGLLALFLAAMVVLPIVLTGCEGGSGGGGGGSDDELMIIGTWRVLTPWRWSVVTYNADGSVDMTQASDGAIYRNAARWELSGGKLVIISDIRDECDYVVTDTTLVETFPDGAVISMVR